MREFKIGDSVLISTDLVVVSDRRRKAKDNLEILKPLIAYIDAPPKFVQNIGAVANEMKNIERKQQGRIYRPRILKELFSE